VLALLFRYLRFIKWTLIEFCRVQNIVSIFTIRDSHKHQTTKDFYLMLRPGTKEELRLLGSKYDGGYFLPISFHKIDVLISAGIGDNLDFERDIASSIQKGFLFDGSIAPPKSLPKNLQFSREYIGAITNGETRSIKEVIESHKGQILLKLDIEGAEYEVLDSLSDDLLRRCPIIVCEFHDLRHQIDMHQRVWDVFQKLLMNHHLVWSGTNNFAHFYYLHGRRYPNVIECVFVLREWCQNDYAGKRKTHTNNPKLLGFSMPFSHTKYY
jgi:hypothetical protein